MRQPSGKAPLWLDTASLWSSEMSLVFEAGETVFSLLWKGQVCFSSQQEADFYREKSPPLDPDWFILMQIRSPNPHSLIGSKRTVLIGQDGATLIGW